jgi:hypothetical protein
MLSPQEIDSAHELVAQALLEHHARDRPHSAGRRRVRASRLLTVHGRGGR